MMYSLYTDPVKNIVMFLPDGMTDDEIMTLGAVAFPEDDSSNLKPTGFIDLYNLHATYPLNDITPDNFTFQL